MSSSTVFITSLFSSRLSTGHPFFPGFVATMKERKEKTYCSRRIQLFVGVSSARA